MLTLAQRESLRIALLGYLASRHSLAFHPDALRLHIRRRQILDFDFAETDVSSALEFLRDAKYVHREDSTMGASAAWSATSAGVLEAERKDWLLP